MKRILAISMVTLLLATSVAIADIIILKTGKRLEVSGAKVEGDFVKFMVFRGHMKLSMNSVTEIIYTNTPPAANAGLPYSPTSVPNTTTNSNATEGGAVEIPEDEQSEEASQRLLLSFIEQKQRLMREKIIYEDQIQTLRSLLYGQASLRNDTAPTKQRLTEAEKRLVVINNQLAAISEKARRAGLLPGDIRALNNVQAEITSLGPDSLAPQATEKGDAKVKFIEDKDNPNRSKPADWK